MAEALPGLDKDARQRVLGPARDGKWEAVEKRLGEVQDVQALTSFRAFAALNYADQLKDKLPQFLAAVDTRLQALGVVMQIEEPAAPAVKAETEQSQPRPVAAPAAAPRQPVAPVQQRPAPAPVRPAPMPTRAPAPAMAAAPVARGPAPAAASKTTVHQEPVRGSREGR